MEILFHSIAIELIPGKIGDVVAIKFVLNVFAFYFGMAFFGIVIDILTDLIINIIPPYIRIKGAIPVAPRLKRVVGLGIIGFPRLVISVKK